jgi:peptidoglycan/LPS O-acetylase OafA/YrhL
MSRGVELPWHIFGRRIRPFSFGLMLITIAVGVQFLIYPLAPGDDLHHGIMATLSFLGAGLLFGGWLFKRDNPHDWGLLVVSGVWAGRTALYILEGDWTTISIYAGACWFIMAVGAWFIERYDHRWQHILAERAARRLDDNG